MMPKNAKHPPVSAIDTIPVAIPIAPNREESKQNSRLHVATNSKAGRSAVQHDEESKPDPVISTSKRKARCIHMHTGSERTRTKRPKNKQDRPPISDSKALNDEDRKPAAENTAPTPDGAPSSTCPSNDEDRKPAAKQATPTPDGVPSTCAGLKRKSTSTRTGSVVSTSTQGIKLEPVVKTETKPAPETAPTEQAEALIPMEAVSNGLNLNRTVTVCRKVAKRTDPLYIAPPPPTQNIAAPLPPTPTPQVEEIPARKKPRVEKPLPTITVTDEAVRKTASPDVSAGLPTSAMPRSAATVNVLTRRRSRCLTQLPPTETSEEELDDSDAFDDTDYVDDDDDGDLSGPVPPPTANVNASIRRRSTRRTDTPIPPPTATLNAPTRRRSSRRVIPTSSTSNPVPPAAAATTRRRSSRRMIPPPSTAAVDKSTRRQCRSRRQTQLSPIETQLDGDDGGDLSASSWEDRFSELTDYHRIHGHCNVPQCYSENSKLGKWVTIQRQQYKGNRSLLTTFRIQELESMGFEWDCYGAAWKDRLGELADYRKIHGHCNVPGSYSESSKLGKWVSNQREHYKLHLKGKTSPMTTLRIQGLESLGFEWDCYGAAWGVRFSELADYRNIHGHCNVPFRYSKNTGLGQWVGRQRSNYRLHLEGNSSLMTTLRIQALESLDFEWDGNDAAWGDRLSELADYRKLHGHCNVPYRYSKNTKLGLWAKVQRSNYRLHVKGKKSTLTALRIQALERLGFE
jgi:hypothetical protein